MTVLQENNSSPVPEPRTHYTLPHYAIGLIVAAAVVASAGTPEYIIATKEYRTQRHTSHNAESHHMSLLAVLSLSNPESA